MNKIIEKRQSSKFDMHRTQNNSSNLKDKKNAYGQA